MNNEPDPLYSAMPALEAADKVLEALRRTVKLAPVSQRAIERAHGWNRGYVSQVLSGHITLTVHHLLAILDSLKLDPPTFFSEALGNDESWATVNEIRERMERYDAAFAELETPAIHVGDILDDREAQPASRRLLVEVEAL